MGRVVRAAVMADMPAVRKVAARFGLLSGWPQGRDFLDAERAYGTLLLAPGDAGEAQARAFGGTLRRGGLTHLGDLFVLPEHQSSGVGRAILARLLAGDGPKVTFASSDRRAMGLYVRHGLRPWCPLLYLTGPAAALPAPPARAIDPGEAAARDARASGGDRSATLAWYAATPGVTAYATGGGYAFTRHTGSAVVVGPAGGETPRDCARAVLGALAAATAPDAAGRAGIPLPGTPDAPPEARIAVPGVHPLVPELIGAGWRVADMDTFMADDAALALVRPDRYVPHPDLG
ncbi:hypothetical protein AB0L05_21045 [Nonomuraea pusilla]|uniref:hypothetical protein n=1 Tax=Nonomuraea pusilla TaxID=46177 RepID=UPI0033256599